MLSSFHGHEDEQKQQFASTRPRHEKTVFNTYHNRLSIEFDGLYLTAIISQLSYVRDRQSKLVVLVQNLDID